MRIGGNIRKVDPVYIGKGQVPVIFTHVGITYSGEKLQQYIQLEKQKIDAAIRCGSHIVCDVSLSNEIEKIQKELLRGLEIPFAAVPVYETYIRAEQDGLRADRKLFQDVIYDQITRGVDLITLHATICRGDRRLLADSKRVIPTTSRGGVLMLELMEKNEMENPYETCFDEILDLCRQYQVAISLGPSFRPGSVVDGVLTDELHQMELHRMGKLVQKAKARDVSVMIEGIGHASIDHIPQLIRCAKEICGEVPYRVMPVSTDIALGLDHISSAIASAVAVAHGADSITCVTRAEHIGIPDPEEVKEGVLAARVAAHSGYIARTGAWEKDRKMSEMRARGSCLGCSQVAIREEGTDKIRNEDGQCTMCGAYCPLKKMK